MNTHQVTLNQVFDFYEGLTTEQNASLESAASMSKLKDTILEDVKEIRWSVAAREIALKISDLLDIPILGIMTKTWCKYVTILEYLEENNFAPDEVVLIPLTEHIIKSEHNPSIKILLNDFEIGKIDFEVKVALQVKGMVLKIQNQRIMEIKTGECKASGTVKCENQLILERESAQIPLPGSIDLGKGVPIRA